MTEEKSTESGYFNLRFNHSDGRKESRPLRECFDECLCCASGYVRLMDWPRRLPCHPFSLPPHVRAHHRKASDKSQRGYSSVPAFVCCHLQRRGWGGGDGVHVVGRDCIRFRELGRTMRVVYLGSDVGIDRIIVPVASIRMWTRVPHARHLWLPQGSVARPTLCM